VCRVGVVVEGGLIVVGSVLVVGDVVCLVCVVVGNDLSGDSEFFRCCVV
jgi:hypothetical protein